MEKFWWFAAYCEHLYEMMCKFYKNLTKAGLEPYISEEIPRSTVNTSKMLPPLPPKRESLWDATPKLHLNVKKTKQGYGKAAEPASTRDQGRSTSRPGPPPGFGNPFLFLICNKNFYSVIFTCPIYPSTVNQCATVLPIAFSLNTKLISLHLV